MATSRRWTQDDEDSTRLPAHVTRVAYDADTSRYTFRDTRKGTLYTSEPGSEYGTLVPVASNNSRPEAFAGGLPQSPPRAVAVNEDNAHAPQTFQEFLPPSMITSPTTSPDDPSPKRRSGLRFGTIRRSATSAKTATDTKAPTAGAGNTTPKRHQRHRSDDVSASATSSSSPAREKMRSTFRKSANLSGVMQGLKRSVTSAVSRSSRMKERDSLGSGKSLTGYAELEDEGEDEGKVGLLDEEKRGR